MSLEVGYTPVSAEECRRLQRERSERTQGAWPALELPQPQPGAESERLLEALRVINDKLDYLLDRLTAGKPRRHRLSGTTVDVSGGGISLATGSPLPVGQHVDMTFLLPTRPEIRLDLLGRVRLVEQLEEEMDAYKIGVEFVALSEIDRDRLVRYIFQKQRECLRHGLKSA